MKHPASPRPRFSLDFRLLLNGTLLLIWCATLSGLILPSAPVALLIVHLVSGIGLIAVAGMFLRIHFWWRRRQVVAHPNARYGFLALACLIVLLLTGFALLRWTSVPPLRWIHNGAMVVLLIDLGVHLAWRIRQRGLKGLRSIRPPRRLPGWLPGSLAGAAFVTLIVVITRLSGGPAAAPVVPVTHAGLGATKLISAQDCATCHQDVTDQWSVSAHAHSATDPYYTALTGLFIQEKGVEAVRYCATCHNPTGLLQGEVDEARAAASPVAGVNAYQARRLDRPLAMSHVAAEGVSCAVCHQAAQVAEQPTNGSIALAPNIAVLPGEALARLSLTAAPESHREEFLRPVLKEAQLCGSCHNLRLPDGVTPLEPTYDEWAASPYPAQGKTCQTCHLPEVTARLVDTGLPGPVASHGGLPGAPSTLPDLAKDPTLLRQAATLSVALAADPARPGILAATAVVTNSGAGHYLPTGSDDLRQVWLETTLADGSGQTVWQSGGLDRFGEVDSNAALFQKVLGDAQGRPIGLHRFWMTARILRDTRLAPLERREVPYVLPPVDPARGPYTVTVRLLYRDVSKAFAEFALNRPVTDLPPTEMARAAARWESGR